MPRLNLDAFSASTHAVVIGVGCFRDDSLPRLAAPAGEAARLTAALVDVMSCGLPVAQVKTLVDEAASAKAILSAVSQAAVAAAGGVLVLYFSGHGVKTADDFYLCAWDTEPERLSDTGVAGQALGAALAASPARGALIVLDCCVSAGFAEHAPDVFRKLGGADFRILLSSAREDQRSWETANGGGTVFSRALIRALQGRIPAGPEPGQITFSELLAAIDLELSQEFEQRPSLPPQQPVFAGVYGRDPLLFVNRSALLSGVTVETGRVSRAYMQRILRRSLMGIAAAAMFLVGTYVAWLDAHEFAEPEGEAISIYKGYPRLPWFGYPRLMQQISYSGSQMINGSALRRGEAIVAPLGKPVAPLVYPQLRPEFQALRFVSQGDVSAARPIVRRLLSNSPPPGQPWSLTDSQVAAALMMDDVAEPRDLPLLHALARDADRKEARTQALVALMRLDPERAYEIARADAYSSRQFEYEDVLSHLVPGCTDNAVDYLTALVSGSDAFNRVGVVLDTALRLRCRLPTDAMIAIVKAMPRDDVWELERFVRALPIDGLDSALEAASKAGDPFERIRFAIAAAAIGASQWVTNDAPAASANVLTARIVASGCTGARVTFAALAPDRISWTVTWSPDHTIVQSSATDDLQYADGAPQVDFAASAGAPATAFLRAVAMSRAEPELRARAVDALRAQGVAYAGTKPPAFGNSLTLMRALIAWWAASAPQEAAAYLVQQMPNQELIDLQDLFAVATPSPRQLEDVRRALPSTGVARKRAIAVLVMHGRPDEVVNLLLDPHLDVSGRAFSYSGYRKDLAHIAELVAHRNAELAAQLRKVADRRASLDRELQAIAPQDRAWRASLMLTKRGTSLSSARQVLTPGVVAWIRSRYVVPGDAGL